MQKFEIYYLPSNQQRTPAPRLGPKPRPVTPPIDKGACQVIEFNSIPREPDYEPDPPLAA